MVRRTPSIRVLSIVDLKIVRYFRIRCLKQSPSVRTWEYGRVKFIRFDFFVRIEEWKFRGPLDAHRRPAWYERWPPIHLRAWPRGFCDHVRIVFSPVQDDPVLVHFFGTRINFFSMFTKVRALFIGGDSVFCLLCGRWIIIIAESKWEWNIDEFACFTVFSIPFPTPSGG